MKRAGLISIGTNSTRGLAIEFEGEKTRTLWHGSIGTRIGEGLNERGRLGTEPVRRTLEAIRSHADALNALGVPTRVIATSALRRAVGGDRFARAVAAIAAPPQIISGEEEAQCSYAGAISGVTDRRDGERLGVVDLGGGSTEYAVGSGAQPERIVSCEIGAVRLTEWMPQLRAQTAPSYLAAARNCAGKKLQPIETFDRVERLLFVGGSATTAIALLRGDRERFEYAELEGRFLQETIERLAPLDVQERRMLPGMNPQRADILLAGALILDALFEATRHTRAIVTTNDLLLGFLLRHGG